MTGLNGRLDPTIQASSARVLGPGGCLSPESIFDGAWIKNTQLEPMSQVRSRSTDANPERVVEPHLSRATTDHAGTSRFRSFAESVIAGIGILVGIGVRLITPAYGALLQEPTSPLFVLNCREYHPM